MEEWNPGIENCWESPTSWSKPQIKFWVDVAAEKLTITSFWEVLGLLYQLCHLWSEHFFHLKLPYLDTWIILMQLIMSRNLSFHNWDGSSSKSEKKIHEKAKILNGVQPVTESSQPLNNPLPSTKIAYEARFLRYFNFLKNSIAKKETKE